MYDTWQQNWMLESVLSVSRGYDPRSYASGAVQIKLKKKFKQITKKKKKSNRPLALMTA